MRVAGVDAWGCATSWWLRLAAEGCDVRVYLDTKDCPVGAVGDGLFAKETSYERLAAWAREKPDETIVLFADDKNGDHADELRRAGSYVIGAGGFCDKLEKDRVWGQDLAKEVGLAVPDFEAYDTLSDAIDARRNRRDGGVFKSDEYLDGDATVAASDGETLVSNIAQLRDRFRDRVHCIIQELVGGDDAADFDIGRWFDGKAFVGPFGITMEKKRFLADEFGPSTGCALNAYWFDETPSVASEIDWEKLAEIFVREGAPPCVYAINTRLSDDDGKAYFLEWTPRLGYDSEMTSALLMDSLSDFLWRVATGQGSTGLSPKLAYSVRATLPPYPTEEVKEMKRTAMGIVIPYTGNLYTPPFIGYGVRKGDYGLEAGEPEGCIGLASAVGGDLVKMDKAVMEFGNDLHAKVSKLQMRPDGARALQKDARKLEALGVEVHDAILKSVAEEAA